MQVEDLQKPILRCDGAKVILLVVQGRRNIRAQQGEETCNGESLVTVSNDLKVHGLAVVKVAEEAHSAVDRDHDQDAHDVFLLRRFEVVQRMLHDEVEREDDRYEAKDGRDEQAQSVEVDISPERFLHDELVFEGGITDNHVASLAPLLGAAATTPNAGVMRFVVPIGRVWALVKRVIACKALPCGARRICGCDCGR